MRLVILLTLVMAMGYASAQALNPTPAEQSYLQRHPILRVSNETDYPPLDFALQNQPQGYSIDLLNLLAERIGVKIEYVNGYTWAQLVELFKHRQLDLLHSLAKTPGREALGLYSEPYRRTPISYVTRKEQPEITDISQLNGKIVALGAGWSTQEYLIQHHPQIKLLLVSGSEAMLDAVARGKAYATIEFSDAVRYLIKQKGMRDLKLAGQFTASDQWESQRFYFLAQQDAPELVSLLNKALAALTPGEMDILERKWFGDAEPQAEVDTHLELMPQERAYLAQKGVFKLCVDPDWMPYEQINRQGAHEGMGADYFALFAQQLGIKFVLHPTQTWQETLEAARTRQCDLISLAAQAEDRESYLDFTEPYLSFPYVIATTHNKLFIEDIAQELDKPYAAVKGYVTVNRLKSAYPTIKLQEVRNIGEGLTQVRAGKVAGYIDASAAIGYAIQRDAMQDMKIAGKIPIDFQLSVATRSDEPILHDIFQKAVAHLSVKEKQKIFNQWIAVKFEQGTDYSLIWKILAISSSMLLLILYWNRKIEAEKNRAQLALEQLNTLQECLNKRNHELERIAVIDPLTGLYNRVKLYAVLERRIQCASQSRVFGIILIDVDKFKEVNDTHGHQVGDQVLSAISQVLQTHVRATDIAGRWGGEEFMVICPETNEEGALKLAEHLRSTIAAHEFPVVKAKTASFGIAVYQTGDSIHTLVARADTALYHAKHAGRNLVRML